MPVFFMSSKKMLSLCLLWVFLLLPSAEAKQKQKTQKSVGSIRIVTDIPNLKVFINGEAEGLAHPDRPLLRDHIPAGEVRVSVKAEKYPEKKRTIRLASGQTAEVPFRFLPISPETGQEQEKKKDGEDRIRPVSEILRTGDKYFHRQRYMIPEGENAFEMYKSVLAADPKNAHAREKIYEMIGIYKKMGADAEDKNLERSFSYRKNCLTLLGFAVESMRDASRKREYETLKKQVQDMEARIRKADQLVREGDTHFIAQRYTTPKDKNAFSLYKAALEKNSTHEHARKRILEIAQFYKDLSDKARQDRNKAKAERYYRQYLPVAQYAEEHFENQRIKKETADMRSSLDRSREIESLLKQGAEYVRREQFAGDGEKNGLHIYQQVLRLDPQNGTALKKIREMMKSCHAKGLNAFEKEKYDEAVTWFDQYMQMAGYAESRKIPVPETESRSIRQLRSELENHGRSRELETIRDVLKKNYDRYRELRTKEEADQNAAAEILPLMREIISNLNRIEKIWQDFPEKDEDIIKKAERVQELRMEMEKEIAGREGRTD